MTPKEFQIEWARHRCDVITMARDAANADPSLFQELSAAMQQYNVRAKMNEELEPWGKLRAQLRQMERDSATLRARIEAHEAPKSPAAQQSVSTTTKHLLQLFARVTALEKKMRALESAHWNIG